MPKVKPSWVCQHCTRPFTTKYSLMRHFKRFPDHAPPNLNDGSDLKPVTVTLDDGIRTVQAGPSVLAQSTSAASSATKVATTTPYQHHHHYTRRVSTDGTEPEAQMTLTTAAPPNETIPSIPVVEPTPATHSHNFGTPITGEVNGGANPPKGHFPFLPPFLEEEQILCIATPQQQTQNETPSSSVSTPAALPPHMSGTAGTLQSPLWPGENMLSPLAPACNIGQVFSQENLKPVSSNSPLEIEDLNYNLLLGEDEATSPLNFLEKTSSMSTSLDFLSPPFPQKRQRSTTTMEANFDFGFAPLV